MIELQLGTSTVSGAAPYLIHHVERVPSLVETALDVQVSSSIFTDDAAEIGKSVSGSKWIEMVSTRVISFLTNQLIVCHGTMLNGPRFIDIKSKHLRIFLGNLWKFLEKFGKCSETFI